MNLQINNLQDLIASIAESADDGQTDALEAYAALKQLNDTLSHAIKQVQPLAVSEAEKYGEKTFQYNGFEFQLREGRANWKFDGCESWVKVNERRKAIEGELKAAYKISQSNPGKVTVDENGEIELPVLTHSAPSLTVKQTA